MSSTKSSFFSGIPEPVPDAVFKLDAMAKAAKDPKINLVIGAYRDENGNPKVLEVVRQAERVLCDNPHLNKEYLPIDGLKEFRDAAAHLLLGGRISSKRHDEIASAQCLSGTGACRVLAEFYVRTCPQKENTPVYLSNPTWGNHVPIFKNAGFKNVKYYRYFNPKTCGVDIDGMLADIRNAPEGSIILLHLCAHNPTGADPTKEQWEQIADVCVKRKHYVMFDSAYQGYASGDLQRDAFAARLFSDKGLEFSVAQSFAKNMGLYCERVGLALIMCNNKESAKLVQGRLKNIIRPMYSNPPAHGARVAALIINDQQLRTEWTIELKGMANRIIAMRHALKDELVRLETPGNWDHITNQIGMFSYLGLSKEQCQQLIKRRVFLLPSGRISVAGLTEKTAKELARHMNEIICKKEKSKL